MNSLVSLNLLCHSKTDARFMQDAPEAVWSILYVSVAVFPNLKQNFITYHSSKVSSCPECIFEIYQLWQSGFSRVYSNCCCSRSFEPEIIKIGQSSYKMNSNSEFSRVYNNFKCLYKKSLEPYWRHHVTNQAYTKKGYSCYLGFLMHACLAKQGLLSWLWTVEFTNCFSAEG